MREELSRIIEGEYTALNALLISLEEQHYYIANNKAIELSNVVDKIEKCNRQIAKWEMERRTLAKGYEMKALVESLEDEELKIKYKNINKLLQELIIQKETNETLIKQKLSFSVQMLNMLNPDRSSKTYNSYGKRR